MLFSKYISKHIYDVHLALIIEELKLNRWIAEEISSFLSTFISSFSLLFLLSSLEFLLFRSCPS